METKIAEYEERIDLLEKSLDLEKRTAGLRECLVRNVYFSTKLSEIIYEMDNLLERTRIWSVKDFVFYCFIL